MEIMPTFGVKNCTKLIHNKPKLNLHHKLTINYGHSLYLIIQILCALHPNLSHPIFILISNSPAQGFSMITLC